jgi:hypothetical protein
VRLRQFAGESSAATPADELEALRQIKGAGLDRY